MVKSIYKSNESGSDSVFGEMSSLLGLKNVKNTVLSPKKAAKTRVANAKALYIKDISGSLNSLAEELDSYGYEKSATYVSMALGSFIKSAQDLFDDEPSFYNLDADLDAALADPTLAQSFLTEAQDAGLSNDEIKEMVLDRLLPDDSNSTEVFDLLQAIDRYGSVEFSDEEIDDILNDASVEDDLYEGFEDEVY